MEQFLYDRDIRHERVQVLRNIRTEEFDPHLGICFVDIRYLIYEQRLVLLQAASGGVLKKSQENSCN